MGKPAAIVVRAYNYHCDGGLIRLTVQREDNHPSPHRAGDYEYTNLWSGFERPGSEYSAAVERAKEYAAHVGVPMRLEREPAKRNCREQECPHCNQ